MTMTTPMTMTPARSVTASATERSVELRSVSRPSTAPWVVAAMAKDVFLDATSTWAERLETAGRPTVDLRADRARRSDLLAAVAAGPSVVLYAGHGRARGWGGYQALRIHHFDDGSHARIVGADDGGADDGGADDGGAVTAPVGLVMAFACSTLDRSTDRVPFGQLLVDRGVASAYLAPAGPVVTAEAEVLADLVVELLCDRVSSGEPAAVGELISEIDAAATGNRASAWSTFEFVGDPTTRIL